jgi:hypothetical protein
MEYHLDNTLELNTNSDSSLYKWSISEKSSQSENVKTEQIPWRFSFFFTLTDLKVSHGVERDWYSEESQPPAKEVVTIKANLRSGLSNRYGQRIDCTKFSMFRTDRDIEEIVLYVQKLEDDSKDEICVSWGCVSYTSEVDFRDETTDDVLIFTVYLKNDKFERLLSRVDNGHVNDAHLRVSGVDGIYARWSPSIHTYYAKVLTRDDCHELEGEKETKLTIPRLGKVEEFSLVFNHSHNLVNLNNNEEQTSITEPTNEELDEETEKDSTQNNLVHTKLFMDELTQQVKRKMNVIIGLLVLLLLFTLGK